MTAALNANATPVPDAPITPMKSLLGRGEMATTETARAAGAGHDQTTPQGTTTDWAAGLAAPPGPEPSRRERVRETADKALDALAEALGQGRSEALTAHLATMARFHRYSFHNVLLIAMQRPDATVVAGFRRWQELGRQVAKGEHGLAILAPMVRKARAEATPDAGPEAEATERNLRGFRVVYVFDIKQTQGKPLPELSHVAGDPGEHLGRLKDFAAARGIKLEYAPDLHGADGLSTGGTIRLREGQAPGEEFSVLAHEIAHELLHHDPQGERPTSKTVLETEAESIAFVVTTACGLQTGTAAQDYIQLYQGDRDTLARSLGRIQRAASEILSAVLPAE